MKQFAIIGLDYFGKHVLEELLALDVDVLIIDKDREIIDQYKDAPVNAVVLDVLNEESLRRALPPKLDGVVIDLGNKMEASILTASYCHKLGVKAIIVKAETEGHAEILELVGATRIVFPNREAAKRIVPSMISTQFLNYLPVSGNLVIAEVEVPESFSGKSVLESDLRKRFGINLISVKNGESEDYVSLSPEYRFREADVALVAGTEEALEAFAMKKAPEQKNRGVISSLRRLFDSGK